MIIIRLAILSRLAIFVLSNIQTFIWKIFKLAMSIMAILMFATSRLATGTVRVAKRVTSRWLQLPRKRSP